MALWAARERQPPTPTIASLERHPSWHFRSGGIGFVLAAMLLSAFVGAFFGAIPAPQAGWLWSHVVVCGVRLAFVPVALGVAEELQRLLERLGHRALVRVLLSPIIVFDRIVAVPPQREELALAVTALEEIDKLHRA